MHNVVEVDTWTAAVSSVDDGDAASAANFGAADQDLADRTLYLRNRLPGAAASITLTATHGGVDFNDGARFTNAGHGGWHNADTTDAGHLSFEITNLPATGTITGFSASVDGIYTAGAHGGLVGTAPTVALIVTTLIPWGDVVVGLTNDPHASTNLALYETEHLITSAAFAQPITTGKRYFIRVTGEAGANKANDKFAYYGCTLTITP